MPTAHDLAKWAAGKREVERGRGVGERVGRVGEEWRGGVAAGLGSRRQVLAAVKHSAHSTWTAAVVVGGERGEGRQLAHYGKLSRCA